MMRMATTFSHSEVDPLLVSVFRHVWAMRTHRVRQALVQEIAQLQKPDACFSLTQKW